MPLSSLQKEKKFKISYKTTVVFFFDISRFFAWNDSYRDFLINRYIFTSFVRIVCRGYIHGYQFYQSPPYYPLCTLPLSTPASISTSQPRPTVTSSLDYRLLCIPAKSWYHPLYHHVSPCFTEILSPQTSSLRWLHPFLHVRYVKNFNTGKK